MDLMTTADTTRRRLLGLDAMLGFVAARLGGSARVLIDGRTLDIGLTALPQAVMRPLLMYVIEATVDGSRAQIAASPRLIESLIASVLPDARINALTPAARALALEAALADAIDTLEMRLGVDIALQTVIDGHDPAADTLAANTGVRLSIDGAAPLLVPAHLPEATLRLLLALQAGVEPTDPALDPEVPLAVRVGRTLSTASEIASLSENDILVLDETLLDDNRLCLVADDQLGVLGELDGKTLKLDGPLAPLDQSFLQRFSSVDRSRRGGAASNGSEPPVAVVTDLVHRMARVSELLRIDPKDPVPLPQAIDGIVELRANKRRIATGRLARVGGAVGVRILRIEQNVRN
jgi:type III secretion protein Q